MDGLLGNFVIQKTCNGCNDFLWCPVQLQIMDHGVQCRLSVEIVERKNRRKLIFNLGVFHCNLNETHKGFVVASRYFCFFEKFHGKWSNTFLVGDKNESPTLLRSSTYCLASPITFLIINSGMAMINTNQVKDPTVRIGMYGGLARPIR